MVANDLDVAEKPALSKLLEYARRDDLFGRGTISEDSIDRAFGLSALIYNLNKSCVGKPERVVEIIMSIFKEKLVKYGYKSTTKCLKNVKFSQVRKSYLNYFLYIIAHIQ